MSNVNVCDDNDNSVNECAGKFGREAVAAAGGAEGDAFRRKLAEYDARVLNGLVGAVLCPGGGICDSSALGSHSANDLYTGPCGVEFERPALRLKPRRVAEDERLAKVLDAMARYVKDGKAVPGAWREELEELLARRGSRFSKQRPWETFPEPAKPNVPQSAAECN